MTSVDAAAWLLLGAGSLALGAGVGVLYALRRRAADQQPVPVRLAALMLAAATAGTLAPVVRLVFDNADIAHRLWLCGAYVLLPTAVVLYPNDRPPRGLGWVSVAVILACGAPAVAYPEQYAFAFTGLAGLTQFLLVFAMQWWRYEHTEGRERRALLWLALGAVPGPLLAVMVGFAASGPVVAGVSVAAWALFLLCAGTGLTAPDFRDIRRLTLAVVVHLAAGLLVMSVFATVHSIITAAAGPTVRLSPGTLGLIAALCAAGYAPAARVLRVIFELLLFGARRDPVQAATRAGEQLSDDPAPALRSLRESLALPYAALVDGAGRIVAASGQAPELVARQSLSTTDAALGHLEIGMRPNQQALDRSDRQVLAVLAPALAQLMHARALRAQLESSRAAMVSAIEEERRRLRRELHDGLGPRLTGVAYAADAARNVLDRDTARAGALLAGLRTEAGEAILEVRRLIEGLRPPSLDQVGLEQTLRQHARHALTADGRPMTVQIDMPDLPTLGAAVEVTAYRIVVEALTNAARHSGGDRATVSLRADDNTLTIEVRDNGVRGQAWHPGVGLTSMRERAELLGGSVIAGTDDSGGLVSARLPLSTAPHPS